MNVERLRAVQAEEREADSLRALPDTFYREVADYIEHLRTQRARAADAAEDPFDAADVRRLTDEIETAEEVAEAIYERRVGKLVKRASLAAAGMPADEEGLTTEEAELFADLVAQIEAHRAEVLSSFDSDRAERGSDDGASGSGAAGSDRPERSGPGADSDGTDGALDAGEAMGGDGGASASRGASDSSASRRSSAEAPPGDPDDGTEDADAAGLADDETGSAEDDESTDGGRAAGEPERVTLRITRDVGEVFGVDERVYDLAAEDVVTLPAANAKPLLDRDAAEEID